MAATRVKALRLPPLPSIRDIIKLYKLRALKQLSQNFLFEPRLTDKIVKNAGTIKGNEVCEVGPGPGSITRSILNRGPSRLILIEKDTRFRPCLQMLGEASNIPVDIHLGDVMAFTMQNIFSEDKRKAWEDGLPNIRLIGNLPFNVSTPLIIKWLQKISERDSAWAYGRVPLTLTFQKEVAERMIAQEGDSQRCRLSIMCQNWCKVDHRFTISGKAFIPKPQVDVGVVHFTPHVYPMIDLPFKLVEKVVGTIFRHRQKHSYKPATILFPRKKEELTLQMFELAGVPPYAKPYQLSMEQFGQLCHAYKTICDKDLELYNYNRYQCEDKDIVPEDELVDEKDDSDEIDINKL